MGHCLNACWFQVGLPYAPLLSLDAQVEPVDCHPAHHQSRTRVFQGLAAVRAETSPFLGCPSGETLLKEAGRLRSPLMGASWKETSHSARGPKSRAVTPRTHTHSPIQAPFTQVIHSRPRSVTHGSIPQLPSPASVGLPCPWGQASPDPSWLSFPVQLPIPL